MIVGAVVVSLVVGWAVGMVTFRRSTHWCPTCGAILGCNNCHNRTASQERYLT
jgi:predicted RNA-binding Zn-ribbon protein involved in translation (DUF1610 family)